MPDKKPTDNEIIKAKELLKKLEEAYNAYYDTSKGMPYDIDTTLRETATCLKNFLDLINRLQAENEKYEGIKEQLGMFWDLLLKLSIAKRKEKPTLEEFAVALQEYKAEAVKEFADKLCEGRVPNDNTVILAKCLLKEMVGEDK